MIDAEHQWILDSMYFKYTNLLLQEFHPQIQKKLQIENQLNEFIVDLIVPHLDVYTTLSANKSHNPLESNTLQLIAKDWLLDQIKKKIVHTKY